MIDSALDGVLRTKYGYTQDNVDEMLGPQNDKVCGVYKRTLLPCTAVDLQILLLREIKKREKNYSKLLLGPRLAIRKGIDVQRKPVAPVEIMKR